MVNGDGITPRHPQGGDRSGSESGCGSNREQDSEQLKGKLVVRDHGDSCKTVLSAGPARELAHLGLKWHLKRLHHWRRTSAMENGIFDTRFVRVRGYEHIYIRPEI